MSSYGVVWPVLRPSGISLIEWLDLDASFAVFFLGRDVDRLEDVG